MAYRRQKSFNVHDPFGLTAMPMAAVSARVERSLPDSPKLATSAAPPTSLPTVVKTIGGALITLLLLVGLVAPPGPGANSSAPSATGISKSFAAWCPHLSASHVSASHESIVDLLDRTWMMLR